MRNEFVQAATKVLAYTACGTVALAVTGLTAMSFLALRAVIIF